MDRPAHRAVRRSSRADHRPLERAYNRSTPAAARAFQQPHRPATWGKAAKPRRPAATGADGRRLPEFFVTCVRDHPWFKANAPEALHEALGNSLLLTHGNHVVLGVRSDSVASYRGYAHVFGGVLEPPAADAAADGSFILDHLQRELLQEIGLSLQALKHPPKLIALLRDHQLHQPELVWWGELAPGNAKYDVAFEEHDQLLTLPLQDALITGEPAIPLTPVARAAIALLQATRQANAEQ